MSVETLLKEAKNSLDSCIKFLADTAMDKNTIIKQVIDIPFNDLPQYINDKNDLKREMVLARLRRENIFDNSQFVLESLWDCEFNYYDYKSIGKNDGELSTLSMIFKELGDEVTAKKCYEWVYAD